MDNGTQYKQLKIEVDYSLGGMNYFSGNINKRGYYLYLTPCTMNGTIMTSTLMGKTEESGFKIFLEETKRKSKKRQGEIYQKLESKIEDIRDLFQIGEYKEINNLTYEITKN